MTAPSADAVADSVICRNCKRTIFPFQGRWRHEGGTTWCYSSRLGEDNYYAEPYPCGIFAPAQNDGSERTDG